MGERNFSFRFMEEALKQAEMAYNEGEVPVGAVIVHDGEVLCADHNRREQNKDPLAHAEMLVIKQASELLGKRRLNDCALYVTLEPCPMCAGAMIMSMLKECFFGASDPKHGCCESLYALCSDRAFNHNVQTLGGIMEDECKSLLDKFFLEKRKKKSK
ncbi:MAG: nucleoside deaminase [Christensenellaceae bacterium]|nr:nucleoside deaminase [Christensenellaceae bacterium]